MVAFTGFSRPDTYIISTTGTTKSLASSNNNCSTTTGNHNKTSKMRSPTTAILVKTLAVANSPTKVPTANIIKTTTLSSPIVHRFLSPRHSLGLSSSSSSTATTAATSSLSPQQKRYSCSSSTNSSSSWTTLLGHSDSEDGQSPPTSPDDSSNFGGEPKKRRRLTHLTPEEKVLRRKLKNRVAAQTARDRKKAQMTDMEDTIANLQAENKKLLQYNNTLQKKSYDLAAENAELRHRLGLLENGECSVSSPAGESAELVKTEPKCQWSAVPSVPQLKKQALILSHLIMQFTCFLSLLIYSRFWMKCATQTLVPVLTLVHLHQSHQSQSVIQKKKKEALLLVQCRVATKWWGPHQHNWTPSMNS